MVRYAAFLRGINVGGHTVKMEALRGYFEGLGLADVSTFIASGNVVFDAEGQAAAQLERQIEAHLREELGYQVDTFVRTDAEVARVAKHVPFPKLEPKDDDTLYVAFLRQAPPAAPKRSVLALGNETDHLHFRQRELYWLVRGAFSESTLGGPALEKALGMSTTVRNMNTVRRLTAKFPPSASAGAGT